MIVNNHKKELSYELADDTALASVYQRLINTQETLFNYKKKVVKKINKINKINTTWLYNK